MKPYIGHDSQLRGIEEHRLIGGKGDGIRLYEINNGKGLELTVSPDRNGDITRLRFRGINMNYMSPCVDDGVAYPLLDEDSVITIPSVDVTARDEHAMEDIANWMHMEKPAAGYQERCYYHKFAGKEGMAKIYQPKIDVREADEEGEEARERAKRFS